MPSFNETIKVAGQDMSLYASVPSGRGPFPAVVVAQHGGGVDTFIRSICDRLAGEGYAAVAPDLFHRITPDMLADGSRPFNHLSDPDIIADINATVSFLRSQRSINGQSLGITGFCMGGRVVYLAATGTPHFRAAVPYYGGNIMAIWGKGTKTPFDLSSQINCPILFHFGEIDQNPSQADMRKFDAELTRLGKAHQFHTYLGADHGFMDHTNPQRYNKAAADTSWPRTLDFFATHLKRVAVR